VYTTCGRHSTDFLFGPHSLKDLFRSKKGKDKDEDGKKGEKKDGDGEELQLASDPDVDENQKV
jgi:hypothetical protein